MPRNANTDSKDFKLERYKYILQQLNALNEQTHKYLMLYQTLVTAILGGGAFIFISWREKKIDADVARMGLRAVIMLLVISGLFSTTSMVAGIFSWMDYRAEEVKLLSDVVGSDFRTQPTWRNFWRWHEFYMILFLLSVTAGVVLFLLFCVIPLIP